MPGLFTYLLERRKRCKDPGWKIGKWGGDPSSSVGTRGFRLPGVVGGRGPRAAQGALSPRQPQAALPRVPYRSCWRPPQSRRRSRAGGVQGRCGPAAPASRSGHGDAGGFAEDPRPCSTSVVHPRPCAPRPGSAALLQDRSCGGRSPMRSGGRRASATAATSAPAGVGGFRGA